MTSTTFDRSGPTNSVAPPAEARPAQPVAPPVVVEVDDADAPQPVPPLNARRELIRAILLVISILAAGLVIHLWFLSGLQHRSSQQQMFDDLRAELAQGTAPTSTVDSLTGDPVVNGRPVAFLEIPEIDVDEVVVEGTRAGDLFKGPGHRRDTPLPGQIGISVIYGRKASYGGPFNKLENLDPGDPIRVTTGQGVFEYEVLGVRREGDPVPSAPAAGTSRLILVTADGRSFMPDGVLRVDADLVGQAVGGAARPAAIGEEEGLMERDTGNLWVLAFWLQALTVTAVAAIWSWHRWGRSQTWIVFVPVLTLVGLAAAGEVTRLMPNLL